MPSGIPGRGVVAQAASLGCYAQLYRRVVAALGVKLRFWLAADVVLAGFFVSHLTPFGSAAGTLVNVGTLEADGIEAATTGEAIALTSLMSTVALIVLFGPDSRRQPGGPGAGAASAARRVPARHRRFDPEQAAQTASRLASLAWSALSGQAFLASFGFASADLLFDLLSLDLMFLALRGHRARGYVSIEAGYWPTLPVLASTGIDVHRAFS